MGEISEETQAAADAVASPNARELAIREIEEVSASASAEVESTFRLFRDFKAEFQADHVGHSIDFGKKGSFFTSFAAAATGDFTGRTAEVQVKILPPKSLRDYSRLSEFCSLCDYARRAAKSSGQDSVCLKFVVVSDLENTKTFGTLEVRSRVITLVGLDAFAHRWSSSCNSCTAESVPHDLCAKVAKNIPGRERLTFTFSQRRTVSSNPFKAVVLGAYEHYTITLGGYVCNVARVSPVLPKAAGGSKGPSSTPAKPKAASQPLKLRKRDDVLAFVKTRRCPRGDFHAVLETALFLASSESMFSNREAYAMELQAVLDQYSGLKTERANLFRFIIPVRLEELKHNRKWKNMAIPAFEWLNEQRIRNLADSSSSPFIEALRSHGFSLGHAFIKGVASFHEVFSDAFRAVAVAFHERPFSRAEAGSRPAPEVLVDRAVELLQSPLLPVVVGGVSAEPNFDLAFDVVVEFMTYQRGVTTLRDRELAVKLSHYLVVKADRDVSAFVSPEVFNALADPVGNRAALMQAAEHFLSEDAVVVQGSWLVPYDIELQLRACAAKPAAAEEAPAPSPAPEVVLQPATADPGEKLASVLEEPEEESDDSALASAAPVVVVASVGMLGDSVVSVSKGDDEAAGAAFAVPAPVRRSSRACALRSVVPPELMGRRGLAAASDAESETEPRRKRAPARASASDAEAASQSETDTRRKRARESATDVGEESDAVAAKVTKYGRVVRPRDLFRAR